MGETEASEGWTGPDIQLDELPDLNKAIELFDQTRYELLAACKVFSEDPSIQNRNNVGLCGSLLAKMFYSSVEAINTCEPNERARIKMIASLIIQEDSERITLFKEITACDSFTFMGEPGDTEDEAFEDELVNMAIEVGTDKLIETAAEQYLESISNDVNHFAHHVIENYVPEDEGQTVTLYRNPETPNRLMFSIEPPLHIHDPKFMGKDVNFTYSDDTATYGFIRLGEKWRTEDEVPSEELQQFAAEKFMSNLNPLGKTALHITWENNNSGHDEEAEA